MVDLDELLELCAVMEREGLDLELAETWATEVSPKVVRELIGEVRLVRNLERVKLELFETIEGLLASARGKPSFTKRPG